MESSIKRSLFYYVLWPVAGLTLLFVLLGGAALLSVQHRERVSENSVLNRMVSRRIEQQALLLKSVADTPVVHQLLKGREPLSGRALQTLSKDWAGIGADDIRVKQVVANQAAELFQYACRRNHALLTLTLADSEGQLVAASEKPPRYDLKTSDLWTAALSQRDKHGVSSGDMEEGFLRVAVPVYEEDVLQGLLLAGLAADRLFAPFTNETAHTLLVGRSTMPLSGAPAVLEKWAPRLLDFYRDNNEAGRRGPFAVFTGSVLDTTIAWVRPLWIVTVYPAGVFTPDLLMRVLFLALVGVLLAALFTWLAFVVFRGRLLTPFVNALAAGKWALDKLSLSDTEVSADDEVGDQLETWYADAEHKLKQEADMRTRDVEHDLELATEFQQAYLNRPYPRVPEIHTAGRLRFEFYHHYKPALALGGDFFDILKLGPNTVGIFIADVMGHGTRSAIITSILRTLSGDLAPKGRHAPLFLTEMNKDFIKLLKVLPQPLFASAHFFVADGTSRIATYSSAGHPAPFHIHRSHARISRLEVPKPHGAALGLLEDEEYTAGHCRLVPEDLFIFFTDGVYEAPNSEGEEYGLNRMEAVLKENIYSSASAIVNALVADLMKFVGDEPLSDDICIVALRATTEKEKETPEELR